MLHFISTPLQHSAGEQNTWEDRTHPWGGNGGVFRDFLFLPFWCFECPYSQQQHTALAVSFFLLREAILLLKRFFQGSQFGKDRFNYSHPLQITPVDCRCVLHLASCFLALYICIPLLICHHCKQKVQSISQLVMRSRLVFSLPSRLFAVAADPIFIYLFQSGKSRTRTTAGS